MMELKFKDLDEQQIYHEYLLEYNSNNRIKKFLFNGFYNKIRFILKDILNPGDSLCEVGCGPGESSERILKMLHQSNQMIISDYDPRHISMIKKLRPHLNAKVANVMNLEESENSYDIVFILEVLEHLDDYRRALDEVFRISKKYVIVSVPREPLWRFLNLLRFRYISKLGNTPDHINHWSTCSIVRLLRQYGEIKKVYKPIPWSIILIEKK